jgi:hypothetical protein
MKQPINEILLSALAEPDYARVDYFKQKRKEYDYSEEVFCKMLEDACLFFYNEIMKPDWRDVNGAIIKGSRSLLVHNYTKNLPQMQIGKNEVLSLLGDVQAAFKTKDDTPIENQLKKSTPEEKNYTLKDLFTNESHYDHIIKLLSDKDFIDKNTLIWTDQKKGAKGLLVAILKNLRTKGFYKNQLTLEAILHIALNTFKVEIGIDTIKTSDEKKHDTTFIPYANDLP